MDHKHPVNKPPQQSLYERIVNQTRRPRPDWRHDIHELIHARQAASKQSALLVNLRPTAAAVSLTALLVFRKSLAG
jgi:hypothetical protein